jgi:hypothetical protein
MYSWTANQHGQNMLQLQFSIMCPFSVHAIACSFPANSGGDHYAPCVLLQV